MESTSPTSRFSKFSSQMLVIFCKFRADRFRKCIKFYWSFTDFFQILPKTENPTKNNFLCAKIIQCWVCVHMILKNTLFALNFSSAVIVSKSLVCVRWVQVARVGHRSRPLAEFRSRCTSATGKRTCPLPEVYTCEDREIRPSGRSVMR